MDVMSEYDKWRQEEEIAQMSDAQLVNKLKTFMKHPSVKELAESIDDEAEFDAAWLMLWEQRKCDEYDSKQYHDVFDKWWQSGRPRPIDQFIMPPWPA